VGKVETPAPLGHEGGKVGFHTCLLKGNHDESCCSSGGSETFQDKVNFFQRELRQVHMKRPHSKVTLKVSRHALLESVGKVSSLSTEAAVLQLRTSLPFSYILQVIFLLLLFCSTGAFSALLFESCPQPFLL
jgi:hypothetical protein